MTTRRSGSVTASGRVFTSCIPRVSSPSKSPTRSKAVRRGDIKPGEGANKMADVFTYMPNLHAYLPLLPRAFAIASRFRIGVYDCLYVVLAEQEGCELLTADDRLVRALQPTFPFITSLASMP